MKEIKMKTSVLALLENLDLEPIIVKCMDDEEGYGWNLTLATDIANEYLRFLGLCMLYPDEPIVPSSLVDDFWHMHILDTQKYADDCENFLGYFLHHFPYFGMRGDVDAENLKNAWLRTLNSYKITYEAAPPSEYWPKSKRCPNCGRRGINSTTDDRRPRLADFV